jgi:hypothetical protein
MTNLGRFPFGAPVQPCGDEMPEQCDAFVLGAYPSAIHVRWVPPRPTGLRPISALAVDNEPTVFWDGSDADDRVAAWKDRYFNPVWGDVTPARLNGPSGAWLRCNVLDPLNSAGAVSQFVTDCLTTYRLSTGASSRLTDTYERMVRETDGLESAELEQHPSEAQIVQEALQTPTARLTEQLAAARPRVIVTLGNAASRVVNGLSGAGGKGTLRPDVYGRAKEITTSNLCVSWVALVHPATPRRWQARHQEWLSDEGFVS